MSKPGVLIAGAAAEVAGVERVESQPLIIGSRERLIGPVRLVLPSATWRFGRSSRVLWFIQTCSAGLVTESGSSEGVGQATMSHGSAFVSPPSLSGRDHSACDLALSPLHAELPRRVTMPLRNTTSLSRQAAKLR